jgi:hypothetical protein
VERLSVLAPPLLCAGLSGRIAEGSLFARWHLVLSDPQRRLVTQRLISKRVAGEVVMTRTLRCSFPCDPVGAAVGLSRWGGGCQLPRLLLSHLGFAGWLPKSSQLIHQ